MQNKNTRAQTVTEYLALITVLGLALALGWDFISQGFMGGIKNLTTSVEIADREQITQGGHPGVQLPFCNCTDNPPFCGPHTGSITSCNGRQLFFSRDCTGPACTTTRYEWCEYDNSCCVDLGPDPSSTPVEHCWNSYCPNPSIGPQGWGNGRYLLHCGNDPPEPRCKGYGICQFQCGYDTITGAPFGPQIPVGGLPCTSTGTTSNVPQNQTQWQILDNVGQCNPANKCEFYCGPGYAREGNTCVFCNDVYSDTTHKCMCGGAGGGWDPATCGNPSWVPSQWGCCDRNIGQPTAPLTPPLFPGMPVEIMCNPGYEAIEGYCAWYQGWDRGSIGVRTPIFHTYNPFVGATGGQKIVDTGTGQEGWLCQGWVSNNGGGSCQQQLLFTTVTCGAPYTGCQNRPDFFCEAKPREEGQAFATCFGNPPGFCDPAHFCVGINNQEDSKYGYELLHFCEGPCHGVDSKLTFCCNQQANNYGCIVRTDPSHVRGGPNNGQPNPAPSCQGTGKNYWFHYTSESLYLAPGNLVADPWHDYHATFCCDNLPTAQCVALTEAPGWGRWLVPGAGPGGQSRPFKRCQNQGVGWYELMSWCSGNCDHDDSKITICCTP